MKFPRMVRTELIISMTLAETFLLLLFVVWYGLAKDVSPKPPSLLELKVKDLENKVHKLEGEIAEDKKKDEDLETRLKFWREHYNMDIPGTREQITIFVKQYLAEQGRGHPRCQENNVLVQVAVIGGQTRMEFVTESAPLAQFLTAEGISNHRVGGVVTDAGRIEAFLAAVSNFYKARNAGKKECRFDYQLMYATKEDYYDGRERFERYFYPARIRQVAISSR